jgi:hypothetical protein
MNATRFRISWIMAFVAFAALNFGAIRAISHLKSVIYRAKTNEEFQTAVRMHSMSDALEFGALPMANVLAIALLSAYWRRGSRRFLWGFEMFGAMALALFVVTSCLFADRFVLPYLRLIEPFVGNGPYNTAPEIVLVYSACTVMLTLPQNCLCRDWRLSHS